MALSCIDTVGVILSDWRDNGAGPSENLLYQHPLDSIKSFFDTLAEF